MDVANGGDGGRTFRVDFSSEGVEMLRERVKEKLKEYMGDYTDDTLVEYVIVLLKNGRSKDEAKSELNVFLDEDSDSFASWLWDHLGSNINIYVQARESNQDQAAKAKIDAVEPDSDPVKMKPKSSRFRHNRLWKGVVRDAAEQPSLQSSVVDISRVEKERNRKASHKKRSISPQPIHRKRKQHNERPENKRDLVAQTTIDAPRRLLQFAVRDAIAVATSRPSKLSRELSLKRLCSVVSAPAYDSIIEEPVVISSAAAAAVKAVTVTSKGTKRIRSSGSVFDRLGRAGDIPDSFNQLEDIREEIAAIDKARKIHDDIQYKVEDLIVNQDLVSYKGDDEIIDKAQKIRDLSDVMTKPVNAFSNSNTWISPRYREDSQKDAQMSEASISTSSGHMMENNNHVVSTNGTAKIEAGLQKESQTTPLSATGSYPSANRPIEDADSRTIFVSNVHFAGTKDSLLRHFNKFGEVLKVIILTDAATGQPKGSAYVEFMKSEAADSALSLDGTSFMSRLLKVVRKNATHPEAVSSPINNAMPRTVRGGGGGGGSPFAAISRYGSNRGVSFPRSIPSMYRTRFPVKHGARSLQWKRDGQSTSSELPSPSSSTRGLTYVRPESKI